MLKRPITLTLRVCGKGGWFSDPSGVTLSQRSWRRRSDTGQPAASMSSAWGLGYGCRLHRRISQKVGRSAHLAPRKETGEYGGGVEWGCTFAKAFWGRSFALKRREDHRKERLRTALPLVCVGTRPRGRSCGQCEGAQRGQV